MCWRTSTSTSTSTSTAPASAAQKEVDTLEVALHFWGPCTFCVSVHPTPGAAIAVGSFILRFLCRCWSSSVTVSCSSSFASLLDTASIYSHKSWTHQNIMLFTTGGYPSRRRPCTTICPASTSVTWSCLKRTQSLPHSECSSTWTSLKTSKCQTRCGLWLLVYWAYTVWSSKTSHYLARCQKFLNDLNRKDIPCHNRRFCVYGRSQLPSGDIPQLPTRLQCHHRCLAC